MSTILKASILLVTVFLVPKIAEAPWAYYVEAQELTIPEIIELYTEESNVMLNIAWCESRLNPEAQGPTNDSGLFQIIPGTWGAFQCEGDPMNAVDNTKCAEKIRQDGLQHWKASFPCWKEL